MKARLTGAKCATLMFGLKARLTCRAGVALKGSTNGPGGQTLGSQEKNL